MTKLREMQVKRPLISLVLGALIACHSALAEPTTGPHFITQIRPYANSANANASTVYFSIDSSDLCATTTYAIDMTWGGSKQIFAVLATAFALNKRIQIEVDNAGCASPAWTTKVQSIYLVQ